MDIIQIQGFFIYFSQGHESKQTEPDTQKAKADRQIPASSRPASSTQKVPNHPRLHKTLSQNKQNTITNHNETKKDKNLTVSCADFRFTQMNNILNTFMKFIFSQIITYAKLLQIN